MGLIEGCISKGLIEVDVGMGLIEVSVGTCMWWMFVIERCVGMG